MYFASELCRAVDERSGCRFMRDPYQSISDLPQVMNYVEETVRNFQDQAEVVELPAP